MISLILRIYHHMSNKEKIKSFEYGTCERIPREYNESMKKKVSKTSDESGPVTLGYFQQEMGKVEKRFISLEKTLMFIIAELKNMREENRELYKMREQLYRNDQIQEVKIDNLEERVHKLEIAR